MRLIALLGLLIGTSLSAQFDLHEFDTARVVMRRGSIPASVKRGYRRAFGEPLKLANPGKPYYATDYHSRPFLRARRLIGCVRTSNWIVLYYEHGGLGHHSHCLVFKRNENGHPVYAGAARLGRLKDESMIDALRRGGHGMMFEHPFGGCEH